MASVIAETCLQAIDDFSLEAAHVIRGFISQATMKLPRKANADHPMSQLAFHQDKASENSPNDDPDNQASNGNKGDGHGDTTSNREPSDRENSRHRSSYDLGSVTDLILRLNPNRPNLLYLTRRPFHSVSTGVENERQPRVAGSGLKGVPVKAVVLCTLSGQCSLFLNREGLDVVTIRAIPREGREVPTDQRRCGHFWD
jgi:hypothetical protein